MLMQFRPPVVVLIGGLMLASCGGGGGATSTLPTTSSTSTNPVTAQSNAQYSMAVLPDPAPQSGATSCQFTTIGGFNNAGYVGENVRCLPDQAGPYGAFLYTGSTTTPIPLGNVSSVTNSDELLDGGGSDLSKTQNGVTTLLPENQDGIGPIGSKMNDQGTVAFAYYPVADSQTLSPSAIGEFSNTGAFTTLSPAGEAILYGIANNGAVLAYVYPNMEIINGSQVTNLSTTFPQIGNGSSYFGAINASGQAAFNGNGQAWFYNGKTIAAIPALPGFGPMVVEGINSVGAVVGVSCSSATCHPSIYYNGTTSDLDTISGQTLTVSSSEVIILDSVQINDAGEVLVIDSSAGTAPFTNRLVVLSPGASCSIPSAARRKGV
jgi:hypothetical protein